MSQQWRERQFVNYVATTNSALLTNCDRPNWYSTLHRRLVISDQFEEAPRLGTEVVITVGGETWQIAREHAIRTWQRCRTHTLFETSQLDVPTLWVLQIRKSLLIWVSPDGVEFRSFTEEFVIYIRFKYSKAHRPSEVIWNYVRVHPTVSEILLLKKVGLFSTLQHWIWC